MTPAVVTTVRTPAIPGRPEARRVERVQARGPLNMGQPLDGSYAALHGHWWRLDWRRGTGLQLSRHLGGVWQDVNPGQAFPPMPPTGRHISLAFDQSARHVAAWEDQGQITVRQWDDPAQAYTYRGPFPGRDPLVWTDTTASYYSPDSDVVLFYTTPDRSEVRCRLQRDAYAVEHTLAAGLSGVVLDQVVSLPYGGQLRGEVGGVGWTLDLGLYPYRFIEPLTGRGEFSSGLFEILLYEWASAHALSGSAALAYGFMETVTLAFTPQDAMSGNGQMVSGIYEQTSFPQASADSMTGGAAVVSGSLENIGVPLENADALTGSAAFVGGSYGP